MKSLEIGTLKIASGEKIRMSLGLVRSPSGSSFSLPCVAAHGTQDGPILVISGATHGNEIVGTGAVIRALQAIDPTKLCGSVIAIPVVNAAAFDQGVYATPQDGRNMASRIYWDPNPQGTMTDRLGAILAPIYQMADAYIDLHGNREPSAPMSMMFLSSARDAQVRDKTIALAEAFGVTSVDMSDPVAHPDWVGPADQYAVPAAMENGVPALMVELLRSNTVLDAERGRKGVMNVLRSLGMIEGAAEVQDPAPLPGRYRYWGSLGAQAAGILWPRVAPGALVAAGEVIAEISDVFGDVLETIASPAEGFLWSFNGGHYGGSTHALPEGSDIGFFAERIV
jgi:predicted deacylase